MFVWNLFLLNSVLQFLTYIPWDFIFLITPKFGFRLYTITSKEMCRQIQKRVSNSTHVIDGTKGYGYSVGWWYVVHLKVDRFEYGDVYEAWIFGTDESFRMLTKSEIIRIDEQNITHNDNDITIYERYGTYTNPYFQPRKLLFPEYDPYVWQKEMIERVQTLRMKKNNGVLFISGPTNTGKSFFSLLLTQNLSGIYCGNLKPWQPGDTIGELYCEASPSKENPLVLHFDEVDIVIHNIHFNKILPHNQIPISLTNKQGWNRLLDEIQNGFFPHLYLILTSNTSKTEIDKLDPSYLRLGRVDIHYQTGISSQSRRFPIYKKHH